MNRLPLLVLAAALIAPAILTSSAEAQRRGRSSMRGHVQHTTTTTVRRDGRATTTTYRANARRTRVRARVVVNPPWHAPPRPRYEANARVHRRGMVWTPGQWVWHGDHYDWQPGHWVSVRRDQRYEPGRWVLSGNQWVWVQPRWVTVHHAHDHHHPH